MSQGAILIKSSGATAGIFPANGTDFKLEELQGYVGGLIEIVYLTKDVIMVINEEGKDVLPFNPMATVMAKRQCAIFPGDYICGDVLMCPNGMVK
ncbi:MAG: DUF3846 domain-containing protein [Muribaculaceae bacterium]|nr:DUF3846 domain-containing protein [Muribaculaceae bacterium]